MNWSKNIRIAIFLSLALELIIRQSPLYNDTNRYVEKARALIAEKQYDLAIQYLDRALKLDSNNFAALDNRANAYVAKGNYSLALKDYSAALKIAPTNSIVLNGRGSLYNLLDQHELAINDLNAALRIQPNYTKALANRAAAYGAEGEFDKALSDINAALAREPHNVTYLVARSATYMELAKPELASRDLDAASHIEPDNPIVLMIRGIFELTNGHFEEANKYFGSAIQIAGKVSQLYLIQGEVSQLYLIRGEMFLYELSFEQAEADLKTAAELLPEKNDAILPLHIARLRSAKDDSQDFKNQAQQLKGSDWPWPIINLFLDRDTVEGVIQEASDKNEYIMGNQLCEAHYYIGEYYLIKRQPNEAKSQFQQAVDSCPTPDVERLGALSELKALN